VNESQFAGWILTCPHCQYRAGDNEFEPSLCGECVCPKCEAEFLFESDDDEEDEDE
jgi:hypothetical protein